MSSTSLYLPLQSSLRSLVSSIESSREPSYASTSLPPSLPPIPQDELSSQIQAIWDQVTATKAGAAGSSVDGSIETIRSMMDLLGRDLVINPIVQEEFADPTDNASSEERCRFQTTLQDRLDAVLTLYEVVHSSHQDAPSLEPGAIFIPLLEELVELLSVETWHDLWTYVETRSKRFTKNMPASKGKALPLLRTINAFLRFLPRTPAELVFRGRVHQFASSVISVADKSAINMRGDYSDVKTTWDEEDGSAVKEVAAVEKEDASGDQEKEGGEGKDEKMEVEVEEKDSDPSEKQPDFYATLWSLQQYFSSPPSLDGLPTSTTPNSPPQTPFQLFKSKSDFVLPILFAQTQKEKDLMGKDVGVGIERKRKRGSEESLGSFFHPRYLTGKKLLEHELADTSFRRQILVQYFILFQFLLNLTPASASKQAFTGGMPKTFVINSEDETWVKQKVASIREELRKMIPDGGRFEETILSIITRERHYAQWKNDGCPETSFEIPPLPKEEAQKASGQWKRRLQPPSAYPFKLGSRPLSKLWNKGFTNLDQLKGWKRSVDVKELDEEISRIEGDEEDDRAMGREPTSEVVAANKEKITNLTWRGIRLSAQTELKHFASLAPKRDLHVLTKTMRDGEVPVSAALTGGVKGGREESASVESPSLEAPVKDNSANEEQVDVDEGGVVGEEKVEAGGVDGEEAGDVTDAGEAGEVKQEESDVVEVIETAQEVEAIDEPKPTETNVQVEESSQEAAGDVEMVPADEEAKSA